MIVRGLIAIALVAATAYAETAHTSYAEGQALYADGKFLEAAEKFVRAYELDHDPAYLFNIAQAYRFGNACQKAADYYHRFAGAVPDAARDQVERDIAEMERCAKPKPVPVIVATPGTIAPPRASLQPLGIGFALAGAVGLVVGGYSQYAMSGIEAKQHACIATRACDLPTVNGYNSDGSRDATIAQIAYTAGGVLLTGGILFYAFGAPARDIAIAPTPTGATVSAAFSF
jgi:tetratricopeptide (TPR) repeat protein